MTTTTIRDDVQPVANETRDRIVTGTVTVLPFIALIVAAWQTWNDLLHWHDLVVFIVVYLVTTMGITVGFHRLLTHRAFKTGPRTRGVIAALGSAAIEGPVVSWVADHRKHHTFTDEEGDPHSPHVGHGGGIRGTLRGLWHAHWGWLFVHDQRAKKDRYARDLLDDPVIRFVDRFFVLWVTLGLLFPFFLGWALGGTITAGLTGLLWGGLIRMLVVHHLTYSINSLCHVFGSQPFDTGDHSRNLAWLAPFTFGEAWHNNHHAFPTSAVHGLKRGQIDFAAGVIWLLEKTGLAWDVVRIPPEKQAARER
ncbi:MAG: Fatty acid desaturase; Delta-9 fatty acid desaturase [uncultured Solirubrobacteraceae bacterium]|uniref:Fatty acid desaturase Delta-9 fatty acid desaturase n=1 Tax=uncultured Solirubrobacteraceae bacterium TaxID=1162706 RepID=A0A6J4TV09_9ACTN|nr:MAG: Fatty acid desaturase; Delta-9 fatty acid desaturase [uncultured Solirubrobacteraceae bacterium]